MNCDHAQDLMSAWLDRQMLPPDQAELEEHLTACAECRAAAEDLRDLNAHLVSAFEAPRARAEVCAQRVIAALPAVTSARPHLLAQRPNWASVGLALALGFLIALLVFPPWKSRQGETVLHEQAHGGSIGIHSVHPVARLVAAIAPEGIEYDDHSQGTWQSVTELAPFLCPSERAVRTSENARCELMTSDGCVVRMNGGTEIVFQSAACVELKRGEIWCRSTAQAPLEVLPPLPAADPERPAVAETPAKFSCTAADAACLLCVSSGDKVLVTAAAGNVSVKGRNENLQLAPNETAAITAERVDRNQPADRLLAASWMQPLLIRKGYLDRELAERVEALLAATGSADRSALYETEIRSLGEYSVLPLVEYVRSPRSDSDPERRSTAMRIVSDLAPTWAIADLIDLLSHSDGEVRWLSAAALKRLTGERREIAPKTWRGDLSEWQPAAAWWQTWWSKNRERYPRRFDASEPQPTK